MSESTPEPAPTPPPSCHRGLGGLTRGARRRAVRIALLVAGNLLFTLLIAFAAFLYGWNTVASSLPDLRGWHVDGPESEFEAEDADEGFDFEDYLDVEDVVFGELDALIAGPWAESPPAEFNRFAAGSVCNPATHPVNWNRTFVLEAPTPVAGVLLLHGLSDSPYSLRAIGERLHADGCTVIGLRMPGHGTCPAALADVEWEDWAAAVRVAMEGLRDRAPAGRPLAIVGYSNGGAMAVNYAVDALDSPELPRADALVLISPMIGITPLARITELFPLVARLLPQAKIGWAAIDAEVDPFKYGSWPHNANLQAWRVTQRVERRMAKLQAEGRTSELPPILAVQSVVDSTVVTPALIERLMERLSGPDNELLLFDVNRAAWLENLLRHTFEQHVAPRLRREGLPFSTMLVTNAGPESLDVVARWREKDGQTVAELPLGASWPQGVFSLSHVAMPIPPDDPIYGTAEATRNSQLPLGSLSLRGEHGVLAISESLMVRMRHNPFHEFMEDRIVDWLARTMRVRLASDGEAVEGRESR